MKVKSLIVTLCLTITFLSSSVVYASEEKDVRINLGYDSVTSLATLTTTEKGGTLLYTYKVGTSKENVSYPTYFRDKIYTFDAEGKYVSTSTGNLNKPIFTDDPATWLDYSKTRPRVSQDSDYYVYFDKQDGVLNLPYSKDTKDPFYIPIEGQEKYVTILAAYRFADGTYSDVVSKDFIYGSEKNEGFKLTVTQISKDADTEVIKATATSPNGVDYIQCTSDDKIHKIGKKSGSVEFKLDQNVVYTVYAYEKDNLVPEVVIYTVSGLSEKNHLGNMVLEKEVKDSKVPIIKVKVPRIPKNGKVVVIIGTNEKCDINCNGSYSNGVIKMKYPITADGKYKVSAINASGKISEKTFTVNCFKNAKSWYLNKDTYWNGKGTKNLTDLDLEPKTGDTASEIPKILLICSIITAFGILAEVITRRMKKKKE